MNFNHFDFKRSHESISSFIPSQTASRVIVAVIGNRKFELYDAVSGQLLATANQPSARQFNRRELCYAPMNFMENDQLIFFQDSESRICIAYVQLMIDRHKSANMKQTNTDVTIRRERPLYEGQVVNNDFRIKDEGDEPNEK